LGLLIFYDLNQTEYVMAESALKLKFNETKEDNTNKPIKSKITETHTEEIIIGLCAPIGTDVHHIAEEIGSVIQEKYGYTFEVIRLSQFISDHSEEDVSELEGFKRLDKLIELGNELRKNKGESILAELAINKIALNREKLNRQTL